MFTGSGMPMRFADSDGSMIDVYQAATQMTDESDQTYPFTINSLLDKALGPEGYYGVFTANMHTDSASSSGADAIVASAQARGVPVVSAAQMLKWLDGRNGSSFNSLSWSGNKLDFTIDVGAGANGLRAMVPTELRRRAALTERQAQRQPDPDDDADDQGRRVRLLRRRRRKLRGDLRRRRHRAGDLERRPTPSTVTGRRRSTGTPTSRRTPGSTTAPIPATSTTDQQSSALATSHSVEPHRPRPEHHLLLPGELDRRAPATPRPSRRRTRRR